MWDQAFRQLVDQEAIVKHLSHIDRKDKMPWVVAANMRMYVEDVMHMHFGWDSKYSSLPSK